MKPIAILMCLKRPPSAHKFPGVIMQRVIILAFLFLLLSCGGGGDAPPAAVAAATFPTAVIGDSLSRDVAPYLPADSLAVGGGSTVDMIERIRPEDLSSYTTILVMAGINDLVVDGWTVEVILGHYAELLDMIKAKTGGKVIVQSTLPTDGAWDNAEIQRLNRGIQVLALKRGMVYVDLWVIFLDVNTGRLLYSADGVHLTADGYQVWAEYILMLA